jgi:endonuclease-3 related protein
MMQRHKAVSNPSRRLRRIYERLLARFGPGGWWPAQTAFEVCLGAILVQNTSWTNVEKALASLRQAGLLDFATLDALSASAIAARIRSSGSFRVKARRVRAFLDFLGTRYGGRVEAMRRDEPRRLREGLLSVHGVGPETADSILLYAVGQPSFVVDAYTRRVFARLGLVAGDEPYDKLQGFFVRNLRPDAALYNDFHAQIVTLAKHYCRRRPRCADCPLERTCPRRGVSFEA